MSIYIMKPDDKLLQAARDIFGDIVVAAWAVTWESEHSPRSKKDIKADFAGAYKDMHNMLADYDIVLEFTSGSKLHFSVSEFGYISKIDDRYVEYIS